METGRIYGFRITASAAAGFSFYERGLTRLANYSGTWPFPVIAPALTNELLRDYTTPSAGNDAVLADLSGRERDVFLLTAKGLGNAEIATSLGLSEATVKSHVGSILSKLKLKSRIQLVAFAYENNVLN